MQSKPLSDDELHKLVSSQVPGPSPAEAKTDEKRRQMLEAAAWQQIKEEVAVDQCGQVFADWLESEVCRWYVALSPGVRSDAELRELVGARLLQMKHDEPYRKSILASVESIREGEIRTRVRELETAERQAGEQPQTTDAERYRAEMMELREKYLREKAEYAEEQARKREEQDRIQEAQARKRARLNAATEPQRRRLADEYQTLLARLFSSYNYIKVQTMEEGDGFSLYGRHSFFSKYTFDIGQQGPMVSRWVAERAATLRRARVRQVGVRSDSGDRIYYSVPSE